MSLAKSSHLSPKWRRLVLGKPSSCRRPCGTENELKILKPGSLALETFGTKGYMRTTKLTSSLTVLLLSRMKGSKQGFSLAQSASKKDASSYAVKTRMFSCGLTVPVRITDTLADTSSNAQKCTRSYTMSDENKRI